MNPDAAKSRLSASLFALPIVALTALLVAMARRFLDPGHFAKYLHFADEIAAGRLPLDRITDLSPGYLWLLTALRALGASTATIVSLQLGALGAAALFVGLATRRAGAWAASLAGLLLLASRGAVINATDLEPETLVLLLNAAALACVRPDAPRGRGAFLAGLLFGASMATRPVAILPLLALGVWIVVRAGAATRLAIAAKYAVGAALPVIVALLVNLSLVGRVMVMDPGMVVYEGMNPMATGGAGVDPYIVKDVEAELPGPDALHVAYRLVASRALGSSGGEHQANAYWTGKAFAFARAYPRAALRLTGRKLLLAASSYEVYDLVPMRKKDRAVGGWPFVPFGLLVALSGVAVWLHRDRPLVATLLLYVASSGAVLPLFYVTVRQRNAVIPGLAGLAALGIMAIAQRFRARETFRASLGAFLVVAGGAGLTMRGHAAIEDDHRWLVLEGTLKRSVAMATSMVPDADLTDQDRFDAGRLALLEERWLDAERHFAVLIVHGYIPQRGNAITNSPAYLHATACLRLGRPATAIGDMARARVEAPGDPQLLALDAALARVAGDQDSAKRSEVRLEELHDPFTAAFARATALRDLRRYPEARAVLAPVLQAMPEWGASRHLARELDRALPAGPERQDPLRSAAPSRMNAPYSQE